MNTLPKYNPAATCPKCGFAKIETKYREATSGPFQLGSSEYMHRSCPNCGFAWNEAPLDLSSASPTPFALCSYLRPEQVVWIVNDNAELGVKVGGQFFFLYKGESLCYSTGKHDDGRPMHWRPVQKREFGECCRPYGASGPDGAYTEGHGWEFLPPAEVI